MRPMRKRLWITVVLLVLVITLLYPFKTTVVPEWRMRIVDEAGNPMRAIRVREIWQHDTIESASHQSDAFTDSEGYVTFP